MKNCIEPSCDKPQFGGQRCKYHQYRRNMRGGDKYKEKQSVKKQDTIPRRTKKRAKDEKYYAVRAKEFFDNAVKNKTNQCFFCGESVKTFQGLHRLRGRKGDYLLDKEWWTVVHNSCHTDDYHYSSYEKLSKQPWYNDFINRLKGKDIETYDKEIRRVEKSHKLNPTIFKEDEL